MIRSFIAIQLDEDIKAALANTIGVLSAVPARVKWVDPMIAHLTLKFLGDITDDMVMQVSRQMQSAVAGLEPFDIRFSGVGAFPPRRRPSVIWAGLGENSPPLSQLHGRMDECMEKLGFPREKRQFTAHVTLGRVRGPRHIDDLMAAIESQAETDFGDMTVEGVRLIMSTLTDSGPEYTVMSTATLGGEDR